MKTLKYALTYITMLIISASCARVVIKPLGKDDTTKQGVRYYAPQLYLLVTYALPEAALTPQNSDESIAVTKQVPDNKGKLKVSDQTDTKTQKSSSLTQDAVPVATYKFFYLPDYSQGYRVKQSGFLGTSELSLKLTDGWQLTELGAKSDSQLAATIEAVASLIPALGFKNDAPKDGLYKVDLKTDPITFTKVNNFPIR